LSCRLCSAVCCGEDAPETDVGAVDTAEKAVRCVVELLSKGPPCADAASDKVIVRETLPLRHDDADAEPVSENARRDGAYIER